MGSGVQATSQNRAPEVSEASGWCCWRRKKVQRTDRIDLNGVSPQQIIAQVEERKSRAPAQRGSGNPVPEVSEERSSWCCWGRGRRVEPTMRIELKDLSPDEIMAHFDVNKDGVLDAKELNNLMEMIVVTDKQKGSLEQQVKSPTDMHINIK
jgi:hypothetical protein